MVAQMKDPITYILTDSFKDFIGICENEGLRRSGAMLIRGQNAYWISRWDQLMGRMIYPQDKLVWGHFNDSEQWFRINMEINIRLKQQELDNG